MLKTKLSLAAVMATAVLMSQSVFAGQKADTKFIDDSSYAVGFAMGDNLTQLVSVQKEFITYNKEQLLAGVKDSLNNTGKLSEDQLKEKLGALDKYLKEKYAVKQETEKKEITKAGKAYRDSYAKKEGVKQTKSGLLYKIEKAGEGKSPKVEDTVKVHYEGTLTDGTIFDSSYKRGEPIEFQLSQLIPAWKEAIPMLKKGGKMEIVLPPVLGYGSRPAGNIPANSTLIFKIELLDFKPAK